MGHLPPSEQRCSRAHNCRGSPRARPCTHLGPAAGTRYAGDTGPPQAGHRAAPPAADAPLLHLTVLSPRARGASSVHACGDGTPDAGPELLGSLCFIFIRKQKLGKRGEGGDGERPPCSATASGVRRERAVHLPVPRTVRHPSVLLMTHGLGRHLVSESCQASISTQPTLGTVSVSEPGKHRLPLTCGDKSRVKSRVNTETPIPAAPAAAPGAAPGTKGASTSSRGLPHRLWGRMSDAAPNSRSRLSCPVRRGPRHQAPGVVRPPPTAFNF